MRRPLAALLLLLAAACEGASPQDPGELSAVEHGARLAADPAFSGSRFNDFACTDCHAVSLPDERLFSGAPLTGAAARPSFWGGAEVDLLGAVNACVVFFQKGEPLDPAAPDAKALYEYLLSLEAGGPTEARPISVVAQASVTPPRGDPGRGAEVHRLACEGCHGAPGTGAGVVKGNAPVLPDEALSEAIEAFPDYEPAAVFVEKVRHGQFFGVGGNMPFFSLEALSEEDLGALLAFYGL